MSATSVLDNSEVRRSLGLHSRSEGASPPTATFGRCLLSSYSDSILLLISSPRQILVKVLQSCSSEKAEGRLLE